MRGAGGRREAAGAVKMKGCEVQVAGGGQQGGQNVGVQVAGAGEREGPRAGRGEGAGQFLDLRAKTFPPLKRRARGARGCPGR